MRIIFIVEHRIYSDLEKVMLDLGLSEQSYETLNSTPANVSKIITSPVSIFQHIPLIIWENKDSFNSCNSVIEATYECFLALRELMSSLSLAMPHDSFVFNTQQEFKLDEIVDLMDIVIKQYKRFEKNYEHYLKEFAPMKTFWYQSTEVISTVFKNVFTGSIDETNIDVLQNFVNVCHSMRYSIKLVSLNKHLASCKY